MSAKIEEQLGKTQGREDWILYKATGYNPETKELNIYIEKIGDARWLNYLDEGKNYTFFRHNEDSDGEDYKGPDPMELWELPTTQKKWTNEEHVSVPEYDLVLPQILIYFWHNDSRLSMEWDW